MDTYSERAQFALLETVFIFFCVFEFKVELQFDFMKKVQLQTQMRPKVQNKNSFLKSKLSFTRACVY